ncbi:7692_t:CDS:2 [Ambispora gerdemannii]|uniref:7692_t:CDS:1 n=1 Tax=Ambispora gerdemannii TaxID=144530 RepID=A0A9N9DWT6_9GLOM|nr:7692_t:CDS:2 [Ambispora gerdemannii]
MSVVYWILLTALLGYIFLKRKTKKNIEKIASEGLKSLPEPPGKKPFIGHAHLLVRPGLGKLCTKWKKTLGDILALQAVTLNIVVLNSAKGVGDLFQKRGASYSSRNGTFILWEIVGRKICFILSPYNDWYKKMTPIVHGIFNKSKIETFIDLITECCNDLVTNLKNAQNSDGIFPRPYLEHTTLNIILNIIYGTKSSGIQDPLYLKLVSLTHVWFSFGNIKARIYDWFPPLRNFLTGKMSIMPSALENRDEWEKVLGELLEKVKRDEKKTPCIARDLLAKVEEGVITELEISHLSISLIIAGMETTASSLTWILAAIANNPEIQLRAQKELDSVVGQSKLPSHKDLPSLPYIRAIVKEGLRWAPPIPMGVGHLTEQDDEYMGYHILKNSVVLLNMLAIHSDPTRYPNPHIFNPDRYLGVTESAATLARGNPEKRDQFAFGAGRRLCVGIHLAELELENLLASILAAFKIEIPHSKNESSSKLIDVSKYSFQGGAQWISPYKICFIPRS